MKSSRKYVVFCLHNRQWKLRVSIALHQFVIVFIRESILARMTSRETEKKKKVKTNRLHLLVGVSLIKHAGLQNVVRSGNGARAKQRWQAIRTSVTLLACDSWYTSLFSPLFDVIRAILDIRVHTRC